VLSGCLFAEPGTSERERSHPEEGVGGGFGDGVVADRQAVVLDNGLQFV